MGAPPGADRRDRPRLPAARDADAAAAGEADDDRADVPLRPAPGRAATASSGSSTSRRSATPGPAIDAEIIELGDRFYAEVGVDGVEVLVNSIGDAHLPPGVHRGADRATTAATSRTCPRPSATGSSATPCACSTRRTRRWPRSTRPRRGSPTACARRAPRTSRPSRPTSTAVGVTVARRARPRPRPRLLHADGVRVLRRGPRGAAAGAGRWRPLRRPRRAAGRQADAGDRVRARARPRRAGAGGAGECRARRAGPARRRRRRGSRGHRRAAAGSRRSCGRPGCASAPISLAASSGASSRRPARTAPTSR